MLKNLPEHCIRVVEIRAMSGEFLCDIMSQNPSVTKSTSDML